MLKLNQDTENTNKPSITKSEKEPESISHHPPNCCQRTGPRPPSEPWTEVNGSEKDLPDSCGKSAQPLRFTTTRICPSRKLGFRRAESLVHGIEDQSSPTTQEEDSARGILASISGTLGSGQDQP